MNWLIYQYKTFRLLLEFSLHSLKASKLKTMLGVFGVSIGFFFLSSVNLLSSALEHATKAGLQALGTDILTIQLGAYSVVGENNELTSQLILSETKNNELLASVRMYKEIIATTLIQKMTAGCSNDSALSNIEAVGVDSSFRHVIPLRLAEGRALLPFDSSSNNVVLGSMVADKLKGTFVRVGSEFVFCQRTFRVVGILNNSATDDLLPSLKLNSSILMGNQTLFQMSTSSHDSILARAANTEVVDEFTQVMKERLSFLINHKVDVIGALELSRYRQEQTALLENILFALAGIALAATLLGIATTMLNNVKDKWYEIGLRMVCGANKAEIFFQFLIESMLICIFGALIGFAVALVIVYLALSYQDISFPPPTLAAFSILLIGIGSGVLAGAVPALRAANIHPAEPPRDSWRLVG